MYVDSNIFIIAALDEGIRGERCKHIMSLIAGRKIHCTSSLLTIEETMWVVGRRVNRSEAVKTAHTLLSMPVNWTSVDESITLRAVEAYGASGMDPQDAIHLASARTAGASTILSEDSDFDKIAGIERIDSKECLERFG